MQSATEVFQPVTPRHDSRLRCGGQRDRHARARGQFQRGVVTVSLPCRLKILLTRFNESLYRNAGAWPAPGAHSPHQTFDSSLREWIAPSAMSAARDGDVSAAVGRRNFTMAWQRPATAPKGAAYGCQPSFSAAFTFSASEPRFGLSIILYSSTSICLSWKNAGSESSRIYCLQETVCNFTPESQRIPPRFVLSAARAVQPSGQ